jgi:hypothetical protein
MWWLRWWVIRWAVMIFSAVRAILSVVALAAGEFTQQTNAALTPDLQRTLWAGIIVNLLIFLYLAFYPGVAEAFAAEE